MSWGPLLAAEKPLCQIFAGHVNEVIIIIIIVIIIIIIIIINIINIINISITIIIIIIRFVLSLFTEYQIRNRSLFNRIVWKIFNVDFNTNLCLRGWIYRLR